MENRCISVVFRAETDADVALYLGRPRDAVEAWRASWLRIEELGVLMLAGLRTLVMRSLATALIAAAESAAEVREARRLARAVGKLRFPYAAAVHKSLRALLAMRDGDTEKAAALLEETGRAYAEASMPLDAAACRYRRGQLLGGEAGNADVAEAAAELHAAGVVRPDRWVAMRLPDVPTA
jgi:hypothetical protein